MLRRRIIWLGRCIVDPLVEPWRRQMEEGIERCDAHVTRCLDRGWLLLAAEWQSLADTRRRHLAAMPRRPSDPNYN